ncbi:MAG: hypothetical protein HYW24_01450 [Candidatus Aenigmarchaeota archaeon]|nr:hypothetical protein [Candidatus Aenigmarchaeota archaeon]
MLKAVTAQTLFFIGVAIITLFFIIAIFSQWIDVTKIIGVKGGCAAKKISYCSEMITRKNCIQWPSDCGLPPAKDECCGVLQRNTNDPKCQQARSC